VIAVSNSLMEFIAVLLTFFGGYGSHLCGLCVSVPTVLIRKVLMTEQRLEHRGHRDAEPAEVSMLSLGRLAKTRVVCAAVFAARDYAPQHFLYFLPEPQGHGSFRPGRGASYLTVGFFSSSPDTKRHFPFSRSNRLFSR
jgi:hypothetical protein